MHPLRQPVQIRNMLELGPFGTRTVEQKRKSDASPLSEASSSEEPAISNFAYSSSEAS